MKAVCAILLLGLIPEVFGVLPIPDTPFHNRSIEEVRSHAEQGNRDARTELALRFYAGHQVQRSPQAAFEWMRKAAEAGDPQAVFLLSRMFAEGIGTQADAQQADALLAEAVAAAPESEMIQAQYDETLAGRANDPEARRRFLEQCAAAGYTPALVTLREPEAEALYKQGEYREAARIFQQLADRNSPVGLYRLSEMMSQGLGGLPEDHIRAFELCARAAEAGYAAAQVRVAAMLEAGTGTDADPQQAMRWYEKAAENGVAEAQFKIGEHEFALAVQWLEQASLTEDDAMLLDKRMQAYRQKLAASVDWYRKAAAANHPGALYMLGRLHASGEGVFRNVEEAVQYYRRAAEQNHADSLFYIGLMAQAGLGMPKDLGRAVFFYQQAAARGSRAALFYLGSCYRFGIGVEPHAGKAEEFFRQALDGVDAAAPDQSMLASNRWVLRAAREYAVILWRKSKSAEALRWMSLAARSGDAEAREMLVEMASGNRSDGDGEEALIAARQVRPRDDAAAKRRDTRFLLPFLLQNMHEIYPAFKPPQIISDVMTRGETRSISGSTLRELTVSYRRPDVHRAVGLRGSLLIAVEFEDPETGRLFWAFDRVPDPEVLFKGDIYMDASMFVDVSGHPDLRIRAWAVIYGHEFDDHRNLMAVIDQRQKSSSTGTLEAIASRNRYSVRLSSSAVATIDIDARFPGSIEDPEKDKADDDQNIIDSVINTITGSN